MKPPMVRRMVDFPHPEGPRKVTISPSYTFRLMCSTPSPLSYRFVMSLISSFDFPVILCNDNRICIGITHFFLSPCEMLRFSSFLFHLKSAGDGLPSDKLPHQENHHRRRNDQKQRKHSADLYRGAVSTIPYIATGMV